MSPSERNDVSLKLSGTIPPVIAALTPERTVDVPAVRRLTEYLIEGGVDGLFVLGSSGEGPTLTPSVGAELVAAYVAAADGRVPVLAGLGETSTERAVEAAGRLEDAGASALVAMAPMYFAVEGDEPVIRHISEIAGATRLPIVLYNIPHLTHYPLTPAAVTELATIENVIALKESSGDWDVYSALAKAANDGGLAVFQGAEGLIARSLAEGAEGAVPGIANVVPGLSVELVRAGLAGDQARALELQAELDRVCELYASGFWLASLKYAVEVLGLAGSTASASLPSLSDEGRARVRSIVESRVGSPSGAGLSGAALNGATR
jgi:dihydrodipicolinate synthase/N-acetylneuraminate lyase